MASMFDLEKHDARFHKDGYKEGDTCMYREAIKDYESVDDLSVAGKISDALEDAEVLEGQIAKMKNENMKLRLREHQKAALSRAKMHLPKKMTPNAPLHHDESAFPSVDDTQWQNALMTYPNGASWQSAGSGSTSPHYIDFNGKRYYVKQADYAKTHGNPSSKYDAKACRNEVSANQFIRMAGFNAPDSKFYDTPYGKFAVSEAADTTGGTLDRHTGDKDMREKVADAYPLMALMYNMDLMQNSGNAFVDANGNPVFLDNGSTFGFSAQGARNKYFDFDKRTDPFTSKTTNGGLSGLLDVGNNGSSVWNKFLKGKTSQDELLKLCAKYNMSALVAAGEQKGLIPKSAIPALKEYAKKLDLLSDKYRKTPLAQQDSAHPYKVSPADAFWKSVGRPDLKEIEKQGVSATESKASNDHSKSTGKTEGKTKTAEEVVADLAKKHGISIPKLTNNSDGTITLSGFGSASTQQMLDFIHDLNDSGLLPGFIASLSGSGQIQVQSAINSGNAASAFGGMFSGLSFGGASSGSSSSVGSTSGYSGGGFSFFGGLNSTSAQSLANQFNQTNSNSGYTAKATQSANGEWQVTLYPTDQKKIAKTFASESTVSTPSTSSSSTHTSTSASTPTASSSSVGAITSSTNTSNQQPTQHTSTANTSQVQAPKVASNPKPAMTPAQVQATTTANRQKAVDRLTKMMNRTGCPASLKSVYQATINLLNGQPANYQPQPAQVSTSSVQQQTASVSARPTRLRKPAATASTSTQQPAVANSASATTSATTAQLPANIPNTPSAQYLLKKYHMVTSPTLKATYAAMLSKMAASAQNK